MKSCRVLWVCFVLLALVAAESKPVVINEDNWEKLLANDEWMVEFFAPWCPACNRFEATWSQFALKANELNIQVGVADVNANPVLSGLFSVTSLPTVYHVKDGKYRIYNGNRDLNSLVEFIKLKQWQSVEPSSAWLSPNSFLIKLLSFLFKLTLYFKDIYTLLTEKYGYPVWAVITLFVIVTVAVGLLVGLFFVLLIDCFCTTRKTPQNVFDNSKDDDDIVVDEKVDSDSTSTTPAIAKDKKKRAKKDN